MFRKHLGPNCSCRGRANPPSNTMQLSGPGRIAARCPFSLSLLASCYTYLSPSLSFFCSDFACKMQLDVSHVYSTYYSFRTVCIYLLQTKELKGELFLSQRDDKRPNQFIQRACQFSSTSLARGVLWTQQAPDGLHFSLFVRLLFGSQ